MISERVREVLMAAAMSGKKQVTGVYFMGDAVCALGALYEAMPQELQQWPRREVRHCILAGYDITLQDMNRISTLNDAGYDFLTIARKLEDGNG